MNFNKITIHSETKGTIIITPEKFYKVPESTVCYVVIYSLKFKDRNPEIPEIESKIPYYISDGGTNKLRANMLYPFMCYSNMNEVENCPFNITRTRPPSYGYSSLLLKYNMINNINIDKLEEDLLNTFLGIYHNLPNEIDYLKHKISNKRSQGNDLISVMQRITNLLDFIICVTNDVIRNFNYVSEQTDIDNGKYRPFSKEQKTIHDYTDLSIYGQETQYYSPNEYQDGDSSSPFNNHFRIVILTILNKYYKLFVDNNLINIETIILHPEIITIRMFNRIVNICQKDTAKLNMNNYKLISNYVIDILAEKIDRTPTIPEQHRLIIQSIILHTVKKTQVNDDELYNKLLLDWEGICLSKGKTINTKNVFEMNITEICNELAEYYAFISITYPKLGEQINKNCNSETSLQNEERRLEILRDLLISVRTRIILSNYIGQLQITYKKPNNNEKTIVIDIDSSETISAVKSKIFDKEGIEPSHQHLMIKQAYSTIVHLENERTIASYNIKNNSELTLVIQ